MLDLDRVRVEGALDLLVEHLVPLVDVVHVTPFQLGPAPAELLLPGLAGVQLARQPLESGLGWGRELLSVRKRVRRPPAVLLRRRLGELLEALLVGLRKRGKSAKNESKKNKRE